MKRLMRLFVFDLIIVMLRGLAITIDPGAVRGIAVCARGEDHDACRGRRYLHRVRIASASRFS
ncbi:hypothetical protein [Caballeronia glathei]|jgi:hypothetical protein|uniref:hypothetical protein n=1 Tax=Caballeronia glathei TaxID=60547 RepID=UPI001470828C|nr:MULTISPECIES: hypothetical protein [Burkholderiaceae]